MNLNNKNIVKIFGIKLGMSTIYNNFSCTPVTLVKILDNTILDIKNNKDFINLKILSKNIFNNKNKNKSFIGILSKYNIFNGNTLHEINLDNSFIKLFKIGYSISIDYLLNSNNISITSKSKGKGFSGVIKRWNFSKQDSSHGNSLSHRAPGSIGQNQSPGRVLKGKKMSGHYGNVNVTIKNVKILSNICNDNVLIIKGSLPGSNKNILIIKYEI
ncbi:50S ribosomal protein L3 [Candidatus Nardonella dryophthoridicola]|uniref:50S ribosomal protein L3 n=1 Tax=Candidatus Nardonella dryophthoridicola TaxID=1971485 RepID=UPI001AD881EC|nr:50S ribosomal protein L3 [Candidatus Nardonella dryophthoridicola]QTJ62847.1 50S ribosomal protein L3 [Candidatus Nardonella dryophthoridicola]